VTDAHDDAAVDLALMHERIEYGSGAVSGGKLFDSHLPRFHIDFDFGDLSAKRGLGTGFEILVEAVAANSLAARLSDLAIADALARRAPHRSVSSQKKLFL